MARENPEGLTFIRLAWDTKGGRGHGEWKDNNWENQNFLRAQIRRYARRPVYSRIGSNFGIEVASGEEAARIVRATLTRLAQPRPPSLANAS